MSMASSTPKYLNSIGLIDDEDYVAEDYETDINFLMSQVQIRPTIVLTVLKHLYVLSLKCLDFTNILDQLTL